MDVQDPYSALKSVTGMMEPRPQILILTRRTPLLSSAQLNAMMSTLGTVLQLQPRSDSQDEIYYWVVPVPDISQEELATLVVDLVRLATVII